MGRITYKIFIGNSNFRKVRFKIEFCLRRPRLLLLVRELGEAWEALGELGEVPASPYTLDPSSESLPNSSSDSCSCMNALNDETPLRKPKTDSVKIMTQVFSIPKRIEKKLISFSFNGFDCKMHNSLCYSKSQILQNWDDFNLFNVLFVHAFTNLPAGKTRTPMILNLRCGLTWLYHYY